MPVPQRSRIKSLRLLNLLSFGSQTKEVSLGDLNVLIGPNGSGKSNLIEAISLLRGAPKDLAEEIADSGGVTELLWRGGPSKKKVIATLELTAQLNQVKKPLLYRLAFTQSGTQFQIADERLENEQPDKGHDKPVLYFDFNSGRPLLNVTGQSRSLKRTEVDLQKSVLSQRQDPDQYPELTYLARFFATFRLYRNWDFGPSSVVRDLYSAGQKNDFLEEDVSNLGLVLNRLRADPEVKPRLIEHLKNFYEGAEDISTPIQGGLVDLRVEESRGISVPASRLSDGTLRWLSMLAILLNPEPPDLVCIEEPELGLHPDMIQSLAKLLIEASGRMQLIVTTHSVDLIDELSDTPDAVIVCEKRDGASSLRRLDKEDLQEWLDRYSLGQLWRTGEVGGNRW